MTMLRELTVPLLSSNPASSCPNFFGSVPALSYPDYYPAIMKAILETGFKGFVAQEFIPKREPLASLKQCVQICDVA